MDFERSGRETTLRTLGGGQRVGYDLLQPGGDGGVAQTLAQVAERV